MTTAHVRLADGRDVDWLAAHARHVGAGVIARRLGYRDTGALLLPGEALEIILMKEFEP